MKTEELVKELAHELDIAWIIYLYLQIHGGDPAPRENPLTVTIARALVMQMNERYPQLSKEPGSALEWLSRLGITVKGKVRDKEDKEIEVELRTPADLQGFANTMVLSGWGGVTPFRPGAICLYSKGIGMWCHLLYATTPPPMHPPGKSE